MDTDSNQYNEGDERLAGDLLVGCAAIRAFLVHLGMPEDVDVYYMRRMKRWPIGSDGAKLIASKRGLSRYAEKITTAP
jgi:hypothetical protein